MIFFNEPLITILRYAILYMIEFLKYNNFFLDFSIPQASPYPYATSVRSNSLWGNPSRTNGYGSNCNKKDSTSNTMEKCKRHLNFLNIEDSDIQYLSGEDTLFTAIILAPGTQQGMGIGTARIGQTYHIAKKVLSLYG